MLQFGKPVAITTIKGFYNVWHHAQARALRRNKGVIPSDEAQVHSISAQRSINILCIAYGADLTTFGELGERLLPPLRKPNCASEYRQAQNAFRRTVLPDVDIARMQQVRNMQILRPEDLKF